jgi:AAA+ superfamily predicted ATPase
MTDDSGGLIDALRAAVERAGADAGTLRVHLAATLVAAGRHAEAFEVCREVLLDEPGHADALELAARACRGLGQEARADRYAAVAAAVGAERVPADGGGAEIVPLRVVAPAPAPAPTREGEVSLADVAGMEAVKRRLELSFLGPLRNPALRALYGKSLRGGLLLWGPPGCGKTFLARAIAGELGARFVSVGLDDVLDMWMGQAEKNLATIFASARRQAPCVLFFDEIDALGQKRGHLRSSAGRNVVVQLLTELDGVDSDNEGVYVLGATNHPWDVDTALRRPGRLDRMLLVLPPDERAREAILRAQLADRPTEGLDLAAIARATDRYSGADLVHLCDGAAELALADSIASGTPRPIRQDDLTAALREVRESTSDWLAMARNYAEFAGEARGAYDDLLDYLRVRGAGR